MQRYASVFLAFAMLFTARTVAQQGATVSNTAPAVSSAEGKALIAKVIQAAGGMDKLSSIRAVRSKATMTLKTPEGSVEVEQTEVLPDKLYHRVATSAVQVSIVISSQYSFTSTQFSSTSTSADIRPMPSSQREDELNGLRRNIWYVAQHASDPQYSFTVEGTEKIGDIQAVVLEIHDGAQRWRWCIDPQTGHILRLEAQVLAFGDRSGMRVVDSSDWKTVDGITLPYHQELSFNGRSTSVIVINSYEINPQVDPKVFEKPMEKQP